MTRLLALARWFAYQVEPPRIPGRQQPAAITYYENSPGAAATARGATQRSDRSHEHH